MRRLFLALGAVSLLACGDSTGTGASSAVGTWNLFTVNGSPVPYTLVDDQTPPPYKLEIMSEQLVLAENGTYTDAFTTRENDNGTVTMTTDYDTGTWSQTGSNLTVTASAGTVTNPTISGNNITVNESGFVVIYRRQ